MLVSSVRILKTQILYTIFVMAFVVLAVDLDQDKILDDQVHGVQRVSVAFVF